MNFKTLHEETKEFTNFLNDKLIKNTESQIEFLDQFETKKIKEIKKNQHRARILKDKGLMINLKGVSSKKMVVDYFHLPMDWALS